MLKIYINDDNGRYAVQSEIDNELQPLVWFSNKIEAMEKIAAIMQNYMEAVAIANENKLAALSVC